MPTVTIMIPCYNEAARLDVGKFLEFQDQTHRTAFLFVNDGSRGGTMQVLEGLRAWDPRRFATLDLPRNVGKAEAVRQGLLRAYRDHPDYFGILLANSLWGSMVRNLGKLGHAEKENPGLHTPGTNSPAVSFGFWDADLATPLEAIPEFCTILYTWPDIDLVYGARVRMLGRAIARSPLRHYLGRAFATAVALAFRIRAYDTQCGAELFRATPRVRALFDQPFLTR